MADIVARMMKMNKDVHLQHMDATVGEAAMFLRCSTMTVYRRIRGGAIKSFRYTAQGPILIARSELLAYREKAMKGTPR